VIEVPARETVICIGCPLGCRAKLSLDKKGKVTSIKGAECKKGEKFVMKEFANPVRTVTATVRTGSPSFPLLPVRTSRPVPKELIEEIMLATVKAEASAPVEAGDAIVRNVVKTGADLIATTDWPG
jgi:CxxC motif-containing protein